MAALAAVRQPVRRDRPGKMEPRLPRRRASCRRKTASVYHFRGNSWQYVVDIALTAMQNSYVPFNLFNPFDVKELRPL